MRSRRARSRARFPASNVRVDRDVKTSVHTRKRCRAPDACHCEMDDKARFCNDFWTMSPLPDGTYDVVVVGAETGSESARLIEVTVTIGPRIGRIVTLKKIHVDNRRGALPGTDPSALLGVAGTTVVRRGVPSFRPEMP